MISNFLFAFEPHGATGIGVLTAIMGVGTLTALVSPGKSIKDSIKKEGDEKSQPYFFTLADAEIDEPKADETKKPEEK